MKLRNNKGITLIALVITIVVLLILAGVSISMVAGEGGIVKQATGAKQEQLLAEEKESIQIAVGGAQIEKLGTLEKSSLNTQLELRFGAGNYTLVEEADKFKITINETGNIYEIDKKGKINEFTGISLNKKSINFLLSDGQTPVGEELIVSLSKTEGNISWEISDSSIATISATTGNKVTVIPVSEGTVTITVKCGTDYEDNCTVKVTKITVGDYVNYDCTSVEDESKLKYVSLKENTGYSSNQTFSVTVNPKWILFGQDENGNLLITTEDPIATESRNYIFFS